MNAAQLKSIADALEGKALITTTANQSEAGQWMRIALAAEKLSGTTSTANTTAEGYMLRAAKALEAIGVTTGVEENANYAGFLKRIVDALEAKGSIVPGSLEHRATVAAVGAIFGLTHLFPNSEPGVWYDTSDINTMFVDSAGVTAATVGQPVGLMLDKRLGLTLGAEIYANQGASVDNAAGGAVFSYTPATQTLTVSTAGTNTGYPRLQYGGLLTSGKMYQVTGRVDGTRNMIGSIRLTNGGTAHNLTYNTTTGEFSGRILTNFTHVEFLLDGTKTGTFNVATMSIKELPGNHATQATTVAKPVLRQHYERIAGTPELASNTAPNFRVLRDGVNPITPYDTAAGSIVAGRAYIIDVLISGNVGNVDSAILLGNLNPTNGAIPIKAGFNGRIIREAVAAASGSVYFTAPSSTVDYTIATLSIKEATAWRTVGAELVTNGGFAIDTTGWTAVAPATLSSVSGRLRITANGTNYPQAYQSVPTVVGKTYRFMADSISGPVEVKVGTAPDTSTHYLGTVIGSHLKDFIATTTTTFVTFIGSFPTGGIAEFDNASIVERTDNVGYYLEFDGVDDSLRSTFAIAQPWDRVSAVQQISWTNVDSILHGVTTNSGALYQVGASPSLSIFSGNTAAANAGLAVGVNGITTERHNGANSRLAVNNGAYATGDAGATASGGLTIAASSSLSTPGNIRFYGTVMRQAKVVDKTAVELVSNGGFADAAGWTVPAGWAVSGGVATATATSSSLSQTATPSVAGRTYAVEFDWTHTGGTLYVRVGGGTAATFTTSGRKVLTLTAAGIAGLEFYGGSVSGTLDNISVKDANPTELVANGGFDSATGWTTTGTGATATTVISGGQATLTGVSVTDRAYLNAASFPTVAGKTYLITYQVKSGTVNHQIQARDAGASNIMDKFGPTVVGLNSGSFVATTSTSHFVVNVYGAGPVVFDDFSVKEVESLTDAEITQIRTLQASKASVTL